MVVDVVKILSRRLVGGNYGSSLNLSAFASGRWLHPRCVGDGSSHYLPDMSYTGSVRLLLLLLRVASLQSRFPVKDRVKRVGAEW